MKIISQSNFTGFVVAILCITVLRSYGQKQLSIEDLKSNTVYFSMPQQQAFDASTQQVLLKAIGENQFVGLAELHRSQKLSYFTTAFLKLLQEKGFKYFALEVGPFSANVLHKVAQKPNETQENIRKINQTYRLYNQTPLVFADRKADATFIAEASRLGFDFWGLDQEFIFSYEMHIDALYNLANQKTPALKNLYKQVKSKVRKWGKKSVRNHKYQYNCQLLQDPDIQHFFSKLKDNTTAQKRIKALKISWGIYCQEEQRKGASQRRANYMKSNFDSLYAQASNKELPKVFVKMGSVHLTRGTSPFGIQDAGKHLREKAQKNQTKFMTIRHLRRFRNGKDLMKKKSWQSVKLLISVGKKDQWTWTDLRPLREKVKNGTLVTDKSTKFELFSYDYMLIPPNDTKSKTNF